MKKRIGSILLGFTILITFLFPENYSYAFSQANEFLSHEEIDNKNLEEVEYDFKNEAEKVNSKNIEDLQGGKSLTIKEIEVEIVGGKNKKDLIKISGLLPEGAYAQAKELKKSISIPGQELILAYDINIYDQSGKIFQPLDKNPLKVEIESNLLKGQENLSIYHLEDLKSQAEQIDSYDLYEDSLSFDAESFSIYCVSKTPVHSYNFYIEDKILAPNNGRQIVKNGESLHQPGIPAGRGKFLGWFNQQGEKIDFNQGLSHPIKVESSHEYNYYAKFSNNIYIEFIYEGKVLATKSLESSDKINDEGVSYFISEPGKAFSHWSLKEGGSAFDFSREIKENLKLYLVTKSAYRIDFDSQGGTLIDSIYLEDGENLPRSLASPIKLGYKFIGWKDSKGQTIGRNYRVRGDITLFAHWEAEEVNYTLVYLLENPDDQEYSVDSMEQRKGKTGYFTNVSQRNTKKYPGFTLDSIINKSIKGDGSTLIEVKYKRDSFKLKFYVPS